MSLEPTGYCWECGRVIIKKIFPAPVIDTEALFCNNKCEEKHKRKQEAGIMKGKRAGYGAAGSTH